MIIENHSHKLTSISKPKYSYFKIIKTMRFSDLTDFNSTIENSSQYEKNYEHPNHTTLATKIDGVGRWLSLAHSQGSKWASRPHSYPFQWLRQSPLQQSYAISSLRSLNLAEHAQRLRPK